MIRALLIALVILALPVFANMALADNANDLRIVEPAHAIARGETITDADLVYVSVAAGQLQAGIVTSMSDLDGMEARRVLRPGEAVRPDDVRRPILVAKGTTVTMEFIAPGITLTAVGKATTEGGLGETVTVLNPISYRQIACTVTGPGTVRAGDTSYSLNNNQTASIQH
jgi:flagella basal body P-ring formation protein FlgA